MFVCWAKEVRNLLENFLSPLGSRRGCWRGGHFEKIRVVFWWYCDKWIVVWNLLWQVSCGCKPRWGCRRRERLARVEGWEEEFGKRGNQVSGNSSLNFL